MRPISWVQYFETGLERTRNERISFIGTRMPERSTDLVAPENPYENRPISRALSGPQNPLRGLDRRSRGSSFKPHEPFHGMSRGAAPTRTARQQALPDPYDRRSNGFRRATAPALRVGPEPLRGQVQL